MQEVVNVGLGDRSYDIVIGPGLLSRAGAEIVPLLRRPRVAVVSDENVAALHWAALRDGLASEGVAADLLTLSAAERLDRGLPANREIASAKLYASEMLARVTDAAIQIHGGMGLMDDLPLARFWRDARVERIWDGTSEIQRHIISRDLLRPLGA